MALPWDIIAENILNLARVMNDILDTVNPKDVSWVAKDDAGNIYDITQPNLAKMAELLGRKYIGASDTPPTSKPDGTDLEAGDMYFDLNDKVMKVYNGEEWKPVAFASAFIKAEFTGDGETTEFTVDGGYNPGFGIVFVNGVNVGSDVDITDGKVIKFNEAPKDGDEILAYFYNAFEVADALVRTNDNETVGDIEFTIPEKGIILRDRTQTDDDGNPVRWRLFIDDGNIKIESVE